ncbi:uncharacterized protein RSE6_03594 [Rhynchosporium secalis]|uniref:Uncharacterized protein n=1 Tax=Rhynchosporium secalis TaxID=38038 RepID=A0A1E1M357_RHYSE|nr:uncharacterized protein RSE6_03594 [Rhynchosporium secalis]
MIGCTKPSMPFDSNITTNSPPHPPPPTSTRRTPGSFRRDTSQMQSERGILTTRKSFFTPTPKRKKHKASTSLLRSFMLSHLVMVPLTPLKKSEESTRHASSARGTHGKGIAYEMHEAIWGTSALPPNETQEAIWGTSCAPVLVLRNLSS